MQERRQFPRITSHFSVEVKPSKVDRSGRAHNISQGGLLFEHGEKVDIGALLDLNLRFPGLTGLSQLKGKVIRCDELGQGRYAVAINFVDTTPEMEASIREMLESF